MLVSLSFLISLGKSLLDSLSGWFNNWLHILLDGNPFPDLSGGPDGLVGSSVFTDVLVESSVGSDGLGSPSVGFDGLVGSSVSTLGLPGPSVGSDGLVGSSVSPSVSPGTVHVSVPDVADLHTGLVVPRIGNVEVSSSAPSSGTSSDTFSVSGRTPDPDAKSVVVGSDSDMRNSVPGKLVGWVETVVTRFGVTISDVHS